MVSIFLLCPSTASHYSQDSHRGREREREREGHKERYDFDLQEPFHHLTFTKRPTKRLKEIRFIRDRKERRNQK